MPIFYFILLNIGKFNKYNKTGETKTSLPCILD